MLRKYRIALLLLILPFALQAQKGNPVPDLSKYKSAAAKLDVLVDVCDSLYQAEKHAEARIVIQYGLKLTPPNDFYNLSRFYFYYGCAYKGIANDTAIYYTERSLFYGRKARNSKSIYHALDLLLDLCNITPGSIAKRDKAALELQAIVDTTQSEDVKAYVYNSLANYYGMLGLYETQLKYQLSNIEVRTSLIKKGKFSGKDTANYGVGFIAIGETYSNIEQPEKAREYTVRGRPFIYKYESLLTYYFNDMAAIWLQLERPEKAIVYYDSLTSMHATNVLDQWNNRIFTDLAFAEYWLARQHVDSAWLYVSRANELAPKYANEYTKQQINHITGQVYIAQKEFAKALPLLKSVESSFRNQGLPRYVSLLQTIAQCYGGLGQWQEGYQYYTQYAPLRDSLYKESSKQSLANAEARYQNKDKQQQIELQKTQLAYGAKQRIWLISGLALAGLIALLLIIIYRNKRRTAKVLDQNNKKLSQLNHDLEEANQTKAKLFGIISHDLRSPISQVYQFLKLQQIAPDRLDAEQKSILNNKVQSATSSLLETMEDLLLWSKTQMNQFNAHLQKVSVGEVVQECLQLLQLNIEAKQLVIKNDSPEDAVVLSDPYFLQTIVRNLLQNAIKASPQKGIISIHFRDYKLIIGNSGGYFSQQQYKNALASDNDGRSLSGLGLKLVDELSSKINVEVCFTAAAEDTTQVEVKFNR